MEPTLMELRRTMVEAIELLDQSLVPLDPHTHRARAVLLAALCRFYCSSGREDALPSEAPVHQDNDDLDDIAWPPAPSLSDYRQERGMRIHEFTDWLGIAHYEYANVVHRVPVDRRLRDQIAFRLGVRWTEIAEFGPKQPQPEPPPLPELIPALPGSPPPNEPWYLIDEYTGKIVSGPHHEPVPENGWHTQEPLTGKGTNLISLSSYPGTEEQGLPPDGYSDDILQILYGNADDDDC